jgi:hypothetical protein
MQGGSVANGAVQSLSPTHTLTGKRLAMYCYVEILVDVRCKRVHLMVHIHMYMEKETIA